MSTGVIMCILIRSTVATCGNVQMTPDAQAGLSTLNPLPAGENSQTVWSKNGDPDLDPN